MLHEDASCLHLLGGQTLINLNRCKKCPSFRDIICKICYVRIWPITFSMFETNQSGNGYMYPCKPVGYQTKLLVAIAQTEYTGYMVYIIW